MTDQMPPAARAEIQKLYRDFSAFEAETSEMVEQLMADLEEGRRLLREMHRHIGVLRSFIVSHARDEHGQDAETMAAALDAMLEELG
ncbi:MAG TPA: hypothetical protein VIP58_10325 [Nocardioides sp.]